MVKFKPLDKRVSTILAHITECATPTVRVAGVAGVEEVGEDPFDLKGIKGSMVRVQILSLPGSESCTLGTRCLVV